MADNLPVVRRATLPVKRAASRWWGIPVALAAALPNVIGYAGLPEDLSQIVRWWTMIPWWSQLGLQAALWIAAGFWLAGRVREIRESDSDQMPFSQAIPAVIQKAPPELRKKSGEMLGLAPEVLNETQKMASRGEIELWGRSLNGSMLQRIPQDYWLENHINFLSTLKGSNQDITTQSATAKQTEDQYSDIHISKGDCVKLASRARYSKSFGKL